MEYASQDLKYFNQFSGGDAAYLSIERNNSLSILEKIYAIAKTYNQAEMQKEALRVYETYEKKPMPDPSVNDKPVE